jgi:ketosteroid isomerase-like protein
VTADASAVTELQYRYARAVDGRDVDGIVACFTDDAVVAFNDGEVVTSGAAQLRDFFQDAFQGVLLGADGASTHLMGNVLVTVDGDVAASETQAVAYLASDARPEVVVRGLRYTDTCVRGDDGGWRIRYRTHAAIWQAEMPRLPISPPLQRVERTEPG